MKHSPYPQKPANLSESTLHRLNMYMLAASATGVGMLAAAQPAEARIIYTPAHIRIAQNGTVTIDLNHDGIPDFSVRNYCNCTTYAPGGFLEAGVELTNEVWGIQSAGRWMGAALKKGVRVGENRAFKPSAGSLYMAIVSQQSNVGPWAGRKDAYLGLQFQVSGKTHYGWARLRVFTQETQPFIRATLIGYAYETIPNKPITTGNTKGPDVITVQSASLGDLAAGASATLARRRSGLVAASH
jgi:hypothetical protein